MGQHGEELAARHLAQNGYRIIARNYRNRCGEIDLIAREADVFCFIEVKTRASAVYGGPLEAVSITKQERIARTALIFLQERGLAEAKMRFDVVAVMMENPATPRVDVLKDAFSSTSEGGIW